MTAQRVWIGRNGSEAQLRESVEKLASFQEFKREITRNREVRIVGFVGSEY